MRSLDELPEAVLAPVLAADAADSRHDWDIALLIDGTARWLHRKGIEILTLYSPPPPHLRFTDAERARRLIQDTAEQYRRLASAPAYAQNLNDFDPQALAARLCGRDYPLARGTGYGIPSRPAGLPDAAIPLSAPRSSATSPSPVTTPSDAQRSAASRATPAPLLS